MVTIFFRIYVVYWCSVVWPLDFVRILSYHWDQNKKNRSENFLLNKLVYNGRENPSILFIVAKNKAIQIVGNLYISNLWVINSWNRVWMTRTKNDANFHMELTNAHRYFQFINQCLSRIKWLEMGKITYQVTFWCTVEMPLNESTYVLWPTRQMRRCTLSHE